jgi:hypothetical protein
MNEYRRELLVGALTAREREVTEYQVNITNFELALRLVGDDDDLQPFKQQLQDLLVSSRLEQRKAQIMLAAIQAQLEDEPCTSV